MIRLENTNLDNKTKIDLQKLLLFIFIEILVIIPKIYQNVIKTTLFDTQDIYFAKRLKKYLSSLKTLNFFQ